MTGDTETPTLSATVSIGMTKQVRQYEPVNVHISLQGITASTTVADIQPLLEQAVPSIAKALGAALVAEVNRQVEANR